MARKQSKRIPLDGAAGSGHGSRASGLTHNPFAALRVGGAAPPAPPESRSISALPKGLAAGAQVVVRHERKGHGGKTVTVIDLSRAGGVSKLALDSMAKDMRRALGAGARAGNHEITVQGDLVERVARFLEVTYGAIVTLGTR